MSLDEANDTAQQKQPNLREQYLRYGCCMAYIAVEKDGDEGIGSAFHIGDGIFITARHVIENFNIKEMRLTNGNLFYRSELFLKHESGAILINKESPKITDKPCGNLNVVGGPWFHPEAEVDLCAIKVDGVVEGAHFVPLGGHLDDWIGTGDFELSEVLILGYPPIPFTREPLLIAARSHVNAVVDLKLGQTSQVHFILSGVPRGGFSGGLAFSEWGFAIGVVTQSLLDKPVDAELGYFAATSIEAVYECLSHNGILPSNQSEALGHLFENRPTPSTDPS